jgi:hypothetical protein
LAPPADSNASVSPLQQLRNNPGSARLWLLAGEAFFVDNQLDKARYCFEQAVELAPRSPPVLVQAAAFFHAIDRRNEGLELLSRALGLTREYDDVVFPLYGRLADASTILRLGVPLEKSAAQAYFVYLLDRDEIDRAGLAWDWLVRNELADGPVPRRYLSWLLGQQRFDEAAAGAASFLPVGERPTDSNRIHHGGFEAAPSVAPLDWTITQNAHAQVRRDDLLAWEGGWSLRVEFDGQQNLEYRHVAQQVVVSPGLWKISARIRTAGITTDQGIGLRLFDTRSASRWQVWTACFRGDSDWVLVEKIFMIPAGTRLVQLELVRRLSDRFDNKLGGVFWIDAVSLTPL